MKCVYGKDFSPDKNGFINVIINHINIRYQWQKKSKADNMKAMCEHQNLP